MRRLVAKPFVAIAASTMRWARTGSAASCASASAVIVISYGIQIGRFCKFM
jgi:hypothetical protein